VDIPTPEGLDPGQFQSSAHHAPESMASAAASNARGFDPGLRPRTSLLTHALAGLEASIVGIVWMFGCFVVAAFWNGTGIWSVPNLFATVFYGSYTFDDAFFRTTWSGLALIVVLYGLIGAVWGCIWKEDRKPLLSFFGALTGLAVYYISFHFVWPHLNSLISDQAPERQLEVAHILWGAALARSPGYSKRIVAAITPEPVFMTQSHTVASYAAAPPPDQDEAESVSGELIQ